MADEDVENYVDSIVEKKLKNLGFKGDVGNDGGSTEIVPRQIKEFTTAIKMVKELGDVARGDLDRIVSDGIKQKVAENIVPVLFNTPQKSSFTDSGFMRELGKGLGEKIGENATAIIDNLTRNFGRDGAEKMIDKVMGGGIGGAGAGKKIDDKDVIASLDPDNPNHLHYYMSIRGISQESVDTAKKSLLAEKENLMRTMKSGMSGGIDSMAPPVGGGGMGGVVPGGVGEEVALKTDQIGSALENAIKEQNVYLGQMVHKQNQSDEIIKFLVEKIENLEGKFSGIPGKVSAGVSEGRGREVGEVGEGVPLVPVEGAGVETDADKIVANVASEWEKDIEKNKQMIKEKEERELREKEQRERELKDRERELKELREKEREKEFAVMGKKSRGNPVFEINE